MRRGVFAGLPIATIAAIQGGSGEAIRMRLHRALADRLGPDKAFPGSLEDPAAIGKFRRCI